MRILPGTDEKIHSLIRGKLETIMDLMGHTCGKKFTSRKNTILYWQKPDSEKLRKSRIYYPLNVIVHTSVYFVMFKKCTNQMD